MADEQDAAQSPEAEQQAPSTREKLAAARLPERTVELCLRGDLQAEFEDLERSLLAAQSAEERQGKRLNAGSPARQIAENMEALRERMREDTIVFRMRALSRRAWGELLKKHPARKDDADDELLGFNPESFMPAAIRACTYSPDDIDDETWADLLDERLTEQQFVELQNAVMHLNVRKINVPNSFAASQLLQPSGNGSKRRGG